MPLKGIPSIISPALLKALAEMGHGDLLVLADTHFPSTSIAKANRAIELRYDGCDIPTLLDAILTLFPLDRYDTPYHVMAMVDSDLNRMGSQPPIWKTYTETIKRHEPQNDFDFDISQMGLPRVTFYEVAKTAHLVIHTGETSQYGNLMLRKGLVMKD